MADHVEPIFEEDSYWNDDPSKSLYVPSDFAPFKERVDVIVTGNVYAPNAQQVHSLLARLKFGSIDKTIQVSAARAFAADGSLLEGRPFTRMRLGWEKAAYGADNPVGIRPDTLDARGFAVLPNFLHPGVSPRDRSDPIQPINFGPIAPSWPSRAMRRGRSTKHFTSAKDFATLLPEDLNPAYFQVAPQDQQLDQLRFDEPILLEHLHPEHSQLVTKLFDAMPVAHLETGSHIVPISLRPDTVLIDTERALVTVTWRGATPLAPASKSSRVVLDAKLHAAQVDSLSHRSTQSDPGSTLFLSPWAAGDSPLPFSNRDDERSARLAAVATVGAGATAQAAALPRDWTLPTTAEPPRRPDPLVVPARVTRTAIDVSIVLRASRYVMSANTLVEILNQLQFIARDPLLRLKRVDSGSVIVVLETSEAGYRLLEASFRSGKLLELCGLQVLDVRRTDELPAATPISQSGQVAELVDTLFIACCRDDSSWRDRLVVQFKALRCEERFDLWDDSRIQAGIDWQTEVLRAISRAKAAILIISAPFLASTFTMDRQIPLMLTRRIETGMHVFPLLAQPCPWRAVGWLSPMAVRPRDGTFLAMRKRAHADFELAQFAEEVFSVLSTIVGPSGGSQTGRNDAT